MKVGTPNDKYDDVDAAAGDDHIDAGAGAGAGNGSHGHDGESESDSGSDSNHDDTCISILAISFSCLRFHKRLIRWVRAQAWQPRPLAATILVTLVPVVRHHGGMIPARHIWRSGTRSNASMMYRCNACHVVGLYRAGLNLVIRVAFSGLLFWSTWFCGGNQLVCWSRELRTPAGPWKTKGDWV